MHYTFVAELAGSLLVQTGTPAIGSSSHILQQHEIPPPIYAAVQDTAKTKGPELACNTGPTAAAVYRRSHDLRVNVV